MRYEIPGANPENLVSADNFASFMDLLSVISYQLSVVSCLLSVVCCQASDIWNEWLIVGFCYLLSLISYQTNDILKISY
jgi:hypothetical protein